MHFSITPPEIEIQRLGTGPILHYHEHPSLDGNVNGPSLIKIPDWIKAPLGKYYLYFGHHGGQYIRLAYADQVRGPWTLYVPGVVPLASAETLHGHLASPDVHIDEQNQELIMFLHGPVKNGLKKQMTVLARSKDGLNWSVETEKLGQSYFRAFPYDGGWYAIANGGDFYRTQNISEPWEERPQPLIGPYRFEDQFGIRENAYIRHSAWLIEGDTAFLFYSCKEAAPEHIQCVKIKLTPDWHNWQISAPAEVLHPEYDWEGSHHPLKPSKAGPGIGLQELRDPAIYRENQNIYLIYSFAGEEGLALAELKIKDVN